MTGTAREHGVLGGPAPVVATGDHRRATDADAARTLAAIHHHGTLCTLTDRPPGYPFGSVVAYALDERGDVLAVISTMAEHTRNATADGRSSVLVSEHVDGHDPLDAGRVTLLGALAPVADDEQDAATAAVIAAVPSVGGYAHFADFHCWRLTVEAVRWVGGFGTMDWIDLDAYRAATVDRVLAERRGAIEHMNRDHADSCRDIAAAALGEPGVDRAEMVGLDRFGADFRAHAGGGGAVTVRVPFSPEAADLTDVRRQLVALARAAAR